MKTGKLFFFGQAIISLLLLSYIFHIYPIGSFNQLISWPKVEWVILILFNCFIIIPVAAGIRWKRILYLSGLEEHLSTLIKINFISLFLGFLLPSADGFAAIRLVLLEKKHPDKRGIPSCSIIAEKLLGVLVLCAIGLAFSLFVNSSEIIVSARFVFLLLLAVSFFVILLLFNRRLFILVSFFLRKHRMKKIKLYLRKIHQTFLRLKSSRKIHTILPIIAIVQISVIFIPMFIFMALDVNLPIYYHFAFLPIIQVITLLPVTFNGLGLREGAFVLLYQQVGVAASTAITVSLFYFVFLTLLPAITGGIIMFIDSRKRVKYA